MTDSTASGWLVVETPGAMTTVQDLGRWGWQSLGVPPSGALDGDALRLGNRLVGNAPQTAALEIHLLGPTLRLEAPWLVVALSGQARMNRQAPGCQHSEPLAPWQSHILRQGERLAIGPLIDGDDPAFGAGVAYLCLAGGLAIPPVLGSCSTTQRAALGGWHGRPLKEGDRLPLATAPPSAAEKVGHPRTFACLSQGQLLSRALGRAGGPIRLLPGPQEETFTPQALEALYGAVYRVTPQADRMGVRLCGPTLAHRLGKGPDIISDGLATGALQVPGNGQPIILLADRQTVGGYPKIATAISADLPRLGHLKPGDQVTFQAVTLDHAHAALRRREEALAAMEQALVAVRPPGGIDLMALYQNSLISGTISALVPDLP